MSAGVLLKGVGSTSEGRIGASKGSLLAELRRDVGPGKRGKEVSGGTETHAAGSTAFAQDGNLDTAEGGKDNTTRGAVSVEVGMTTGGTCLNVSLGDKGSLEESSPHGMVSSVDDQGFDGFDGGGCRQVDAQGYCKVHEKSSW